MTESLAISLNRKKIFFFALISTLVTILCLYFTITSLNDVLNTSYVPTGKSNKNQSCANLVVFPVCFLIYFSVTLFAISIFIRSILKKEVIVINHSGILYNKFHIFSKPVFIHWNYIQDIRIVDGTSRGNLLQKILSKILNNKSIVLKLKEEFYTDLSPIKKTIYKLNGKFSKGFSFQIRLIFTKSDTNEILDKILIKSLPYVKNTQQIYQSK